MLEEAYGTAAMEKPEAYEWQKRFHDGHVSIMIHTVGNCQLQQIIKALSMCKK
jgi:hypothetical protein